MSRYGQNKLLQKALLLGGLVLALLFLGKCGPHSHGHSSSSAQSKRVKVPLVLQNKASLALESQADENENSGLDLLQNATNIQAYLSGCKSGESGVLVISGTTVSLLHGDGNCLVKLTQFQLGSTIYQAGLPSSVSFTTWLANDSGVFQSTTSTTDTIKVWVSTQVTQSGVLSTDTVTYIIQNVGAGATQNESQTQVSFGGSLSVLGQTSPSFTYVAAGLNAVNANGSPSIWVTLQCSTSLTGSPTYRCNNILLKGNSSGGLDYILIPDVYSQGTLSVSQLVSAFGANTPVYVNVGQIAPGGVDGHGNTLTNGGFITNETSGGTTAGSSAIYPSHLNYVLMVRARDDTGAAPSYMYFYITLASQSEGVTGCGTTFAGGAGTSGSPYQINSPTTLANTVNCVTSATFFIQTAPIVLGGSGSPWTPIQLFGRYNGNNQTISNMYVSSSSANIGLFSTINSGATVSNLTISGTVIGSGNLSAGILAGTSSGAITSVSTSGSVTVSGVTTASYWGGLIGTVAASTVTSSSSSATVSFTAASTSGTASEGGLVGWLKNGTTITSSWATGTLNTNTGTTSLTNFYSGGIAGLVSTTANGNINNSYSTTSQTVSFVGSGTSTYVGGIFAQGLGLVSSGCFAAPTLTHNGTSSVLYLGGFGGGFTNSFSGILVNTAYTMGTISVSGTVTTPNIGGFAGKILSASFPIQTVYSALSSITGTGANGFIGGGSGSNIAGSYFYKNASVPTDAATGITTFTTVTQMQTQSNFSNFTFGTGASTWWRMPSANPLAPAGLLSPVQNWQCGTSGITCI